MPTTWKFQRVCFHTFFIYWIDFICATFCTLYASQQSVRYLCCTKLIIVLLALHTHSMFSPYSLLLSPICELQSLFFLSNIYTPIKFLCTFLFRLKLFFNYLILLLQDLNYWIALTFYVLFICNHLNLVIMIICKCIK